MDAEAYLQRLLEELHKLLEVGALHLGVGPARRLLHVVHLKLSGVSVGAAAAVTGAGVASSAGEKRKRAVGASASAPNVNEAAAAAAAEGSAPMEESAAPAILSAQETLARFQLYCPPAIDAAKKAVVTVFLTDARLRRGGGRTCRSRSRRRRASSATPASRTRRSRASALSARAKLRAF